MDPAHVEEVEDAMCGSSAGSGSETRGKGLGIGSSWLAVGLGHRAKGRGFRVLG